MATEIYKLVIEYQDGGGQYAANVLHYELNNVAGTVPFEAAGDIIAAFISNNQTLILPCLSSDCKLTSYRCNRISTGGGPEALQIVNASGTGPATMGSGSVGGQFKWIVASPGTHPGRMTLPSAPSTWIIQDKLISAYIAAMQALGNVMLTVLTLSTGDLAGLCVYVKKTHTDHLVQFYVINPKIGVQRRRLLRTV